MGFLDRLIRRDAKLAQSPKPEQHSPGDRSPVAPLGGVFPASTITTTEGAPLNAQADHYIISMLPPEPDEAKMKNLIRTIITANGYIPGSATWEIRVNAMALEDSFSMFSLMGFEKRSGKKADKGLTRLHSFTGNDVKGKMMAVFFEK